MANHANGQFYRLFSPPSLSLSLPLLLYFILFQGRRQAEIIARRSAFYSPHSLTSHGYFAPVSCLRRQLGISGQGNYVACSIVFEGLLGVLFCSVVLLACHSDLHSAILTDVLEHTILPCIVQLQQLIPQTSLRCFSLTTTIRISRARALLKLVLQAVSRLQRVSKSLKVLLSLSLHFSAFAFLTSGDDRVLRQHLKRRGCSGDWRAPAAPTGSQHFGVHRARVHGVEAQP